MNEAAQPADIRLETLPDPRPLVLSHTGVRITHIPSGRVFESRLPQSMHKNREAAIDALSRALGQGGDRRE